MATTPTPAPKPGMMDWIKALSEIPAEAKSAGQGLQAVQQNVDQGALGNVKAPTVPPAAPQTALPLSPRSYVPQGPYGSRPGEMRLDSNGDPISGFNGVRTNGGI